MNRALRRGGLAASFLIGSAIFSGCSSAASNEVEDQSTNPWLSGVLVPSPSQPNYNLTFDSSADGNVIVVGCPGTPRAPLYRMLPDEVLVLRREGNVWSSTPLEKPQNRLVVEFGNSVAISDDGTRIVVAGDHAVLVYEAVGSDWTPTFLDASDRAYLSTDAVAISGDGNAIAVADEGSDGGFLFLHKNDEWSYASSIPGDFKEASRLELSFDGETLALADNASVRVHQRNGATLDQGEMIASAVSGSKILAFALALSAEGNILVASAEGQRSVAIFARSGNSWSSQILPVPERNVSFGNHVALSGDGNTLAVSDDLRSDLRPIAGAVHMYTRSESTWSAGRTVPIPAEGESLGDGLRLSDDGKTLVTTISPPRAVQSLMVFTRR